MQITSPLLYSKDLPSEKKNFPSPEMTYMISQWLWLCSPRSRMLEYFSIKLIVGIAFLSLG